MNPIDIILWSLAAVAVVLAIAIIMAIVVVIALALGSPRKSPEHHIVINNPTTTDWNSDGR